MLVGLSISGNGTRETVESLNELALLADTAGAEVVEQILQVRRAIHPSTFIGSGKAQEIAELCQAEDIDLVIFDDDLTPAQIKNLDKQIERRILDRSGLILDIFAGRARSRQARIQVELAQLQYMMPRLTRQWDHLSRQEGGVGSGGAIGVRGPGETQLEIDRRLIRHKIKYLTKQLKTVEGHYNVQRKQRSDMFCAALVGYTNAGKSTAFNAITNAGTLVENRLFATLDSTTRSIDVGIGQDVLISDTVGFISKLPHHLVSSFKSTLTEVYSADLLLHVVDISHPCYEEHIETVNTVLDDLGASKLPSLLVFNKVDLLKEPGILNRLNAEYPGSMTMSALVQEDVARLRERIGIVANETRLEEFDLFVPHHAASILSAIYESGQIVVREDEPEGVRVVVRLEPATVNRLKKRLDEFTSMELHQ
ncbi:MAG: GTPase HflX [Candidatus Latescibacteria bacterium]|nr:GTPase HflX [Candidatus Latescibacterota bacterium]